MSSGKPTPVSTRIAPALGCLMTKPCTGMLFMASMRARWRRTIYIRMSREKRRDREQAEQQRHVNDRVGEHAPGPPPAAEVEHGDRDQTEAQHGGARKVDRVARTGEERHHAHDHGKDRIDDALTLG